MRIDGWHIDGFGVHHDLQVTDLPRGLTVITGPNESGKTTLQHFVSGVLFGYPNKGRPDRHDPINGGNYGGRLFVTDEQGRAIVIHRGARKGSLRLATADGDLDPGELADLVGGASKELFQSVFAVHLADLAELKALTADQVRERVFSAGIVGAGKAAEAALAELGAARDMLLRPSGRGSFLLKSLREDLAGARARLAEARTEAERLPALLEQIRQLDDDADALRQEGRALRLQHDLLEAVHGLWPAWVAAHDAQGELDALGPVPSWGPRSVAALRDAITLRSERAAALADATRQLADATQTADALPAPGLAAALADEVDRLASQAEAEVQRRQLITELQPRLAAQETAVDAALGRLGPGHDLAWLTDHAPRIEVSADLRALAAAAQEARRAAEAAVDAQRRIAAELADHGEELRLAAEAAVAATGPSASSATRYLDATARLVALLGQRDAAARHLAAVAAPADPAPSTQPGTVGRRVAIAGVAALVAGVALVAGGATAAGIALAIVGLGLLGGGAALGRSRGAAPVTSPTAALASHVRSELAQIDAELIPVLATLDLDERPTASQAAEIQRHAHRLASEAHERAAAVRQTSDLVDAHRRTTERRLAAADAEVARTSEALAAASGRWTSWLTEHHLPASLDPAGATDALAAVEQARAAALLANQVGEDLTRALARSSEFSAMVADIASSLGLEPDQDALVTLERLVADVRRARQEAEAIERAATLVEHRRNDRERAIANLEHADAELKALLGEAAVVDTDDALEQIERVEHARRLRTVIDEAEAHLASAVGGADEQRRQARALLTDPLADPERWTAQLRELQVQLTTAHDRRDTVLHQRATLQGQVDHLSASADIPSLELRVSDLETQLVDAVTQWASFHLAHQVVEGTLTRYQRERQPEVVRRAGALFHQATNGRYTRLEVRGTEVIAINRAGQEVPASGLSQGTTEQLYLCMRFALAESFSKTASLPLLLDDITVNADADRLPRLAEMIATVAQTHQVLVFSCQDQMVDLLRAADPLARVVTLPGHATDAGHIGRAVS